MPSQDDEFAKMLDEEQAKLDVKFDAKIKLSREQINELCPSPVDKEHLNALVRIVGGATSENEAKAQLAKNMEAYGAVAVRLLRKFVLG